MTTRFENLTPEKATGSVYTPIGMADDLSASILEHLEPARSFSILEPAVGDGRLLRSVLSRLNPASSISVVAYELNPVVLRETAEALVKEFPQVDFLFVGKDIIQDFLGGHLMGRQFDIVVANPPYLRTQVMGSEKAKALAKLFNLRGRLDIYYVFVLIALELLSDRGIAGFVTSNRFMKVKSGESLRSYLLANSRLLEIIDYGDTKLFDAAVLPCTFVFKRGRTDPDLVDYYSIYRTEANANPKRTGDFPYELIRCSSELDFCGTRFDVQSGHLVVSEADGTWTVGTEESTAWLHSVDAHTDRKFGDLGRIRVGIKTTADKAFILKRPESFGDILPELARPLVTHRNAGNIVGEKEPKWMVVYPHTVRGGKRSVVSLDDFPKTSKYLEIHREQLENRSYVKKAGRRWYEIWVPQDPSKWSKPKIVFRDIADRPQFWLEASGAIINGDCYWLDSPDDIEKSEIYLALGVLNSTFITEYYDRRVNNKLYAGKRRFMTQYVEQFPLPSLEKTEAREIVQIVNTVVKRGTSATPTDISRLNSLVYACFGLTSKKSLGSGN